MCISSRSLDKKIAHCCFSIDKMTASRTTVFGHATGNVLSFFFFFFFFFCFVLFCFVFVLFFVFGFFCLFVCFFVCFFVLIFLSNSDSFQYQGK